MPSLVVVDTETNEIVCREGRQKVHLDPTGASFHSWVCLCACQTVAPLTPLPPYTTGVNFPWHPQPFYTLDEAMGVAMDSTPTLLLMLDGASAYVPTYLAAGRHQQCPGTHH